MIKTGIGLPNTCSRCGEHCTGQWWAEHEDAARSGAGLCDECASVRQRQIHFGDEMLGVGDAARSGSGLGDECTQPAAPVRYEPVGEMLTRVQPSSTTPRVPLMGKRSKK